jgi:hypothetical protein
MIVLTSLAIIALTSKFHTRLSDRPIAQLHPKAPPEPALPPAHKIVD